MSLIPIKNMVFLWTPEWAENENLYIRFKVCPNYGGDFPERDRLHAYGWAGRGCLAFSEANTAKKINILLIECLQILAQNKKLKPIEVIRELQKIKELHQSFPDFPPEEACTK